jgi:hypothetical protein
MSDLIPYRPWKFKDGIGDRIMRFMNPEIQTHRFEVDRFGFQYGLMPLDQLRPLVSVPPSAKDHHQRLLEATQLYSEPILVVKSGDEKFAVVGNHELYAAAVAYQTELARPNKRRSSDICLVAVCDEQYLSSIAVNELNYASDRAVAEIRSDVIGHGFADSPRTDDPTAITILLGEETFSMRLESGNQWTQRLVVALGLRSLDFGSNEQNLSTKEGQTKVTIVSPHLSPIVLNCGSEFPYGTYEANIRPLPGANMWSLRDFRAE